MPDETTGGVIAAVGGVCTAFATTVGVVVAHVRGVAKNGKANTADIEATNTRVGVLESRVEEKIAEDKSEHKTLSDSMMGMQKANNEEHGKIWVKMDKQVEATNELAVQVAAANATSEAMNQNLERLLKKD